MSPTITTPVKGFTGSVVGVTFTNGTGETTDPAAVAYFERQGYGIEAEETTPKLTPKERLQAEAIELGLSAEGTNEELKARIAEHKAAANKAPTGDSSDTDDKNEEKNE